MEEENGIQMKAVMIMTDGMELKWTLALLRFSSWVDEYELP